MLLLAASLVVAASLGRGAEAASAPLAPRIGAQPVGALALRARAVGARARVSLCAAARGGDAPARGVARTAAARAVDAQLVAIALPALAGLFIDPLATLVDTAWAGSLGATELAALGAAASIFGLCAKSFNFLLSATTSAVAAAAATASAAKGARSTASTRARGAPPLQLADDVAEIAASALALALAIGLPLGLAIGACAPAILSASSIVPGSAVYAPALGYLRFRAPAAPCVLGTMALTGVFRGLRDTRTPLVALAASTVANVALDPLLVALLPAELKVAGLALATTLSQAIGLAILLAALGRRRPPRAPFRPTGARVLGLARSASVLTARTFCALLVYARASAAAAACAPLAGAAHAIAFQIWMSASLLADALAIACQALLASALGAASAGASSAARQPSAPAPSPALVVARTARLSAFLALAVGAALAVGRSVLLRALTSDAAVRASAARVWPFVVGSQPATVGAFAIDGVLFGANKFGSAAATLICAAGPALLLLRGAGGRCSDAAGTDARLALVWGALSAFMAVRALVGVAIVLVGGRRAQALGPRAARAAGG
ncbi:hypothetical protein KFE25_002281 [Diacronema lutheri]|uniref:Protein DETOXIFICATION n=1 Tax=Diacronema lutheri TaxID=2081491 RepID=A0A8J5X7C9_DIALT|nr:hypothetical protein KFE25_002281 [Diacronema lutheri]